MYKLSIVLFLVGFFACGNQTDNPIDIISKKNITVNKPDFNYETFGRESVKRCLPGWELITKSNPRSSGININHQLCQPKSECPIAWAVDSRSGECLDLSNSCNRSARTELNFNLNTVTVGPDQNFSTIQEAINDLGIAGGIVEIAGGVYDETITLKHNIHLIGSCDEKVIIRPSNRESHRENKTLAIVNISGMDIEASLYNIKIDGTSSNLFGIKTEFLTNNQNPYGSGFIKASNIIIENTNTYGIQIMGTGDFIAEDSLIRNVQSRSSEIRVNGKPTGEFLKHLGLGIEVSKKARLNLLRTNLERNRSVGIMAINHMSSVTLKDVIVRGTLPSESSNQYGYGIYGIRAVDVSANNLHLIGNTSYGMILSSDYTYADLENVNISGTLPSKLSGEKGIGLLLKNPTAVSLKGGFFSNNHESSIRIEGDPECSDNPNEEQYYKPHCTTFKLSDSIIQQTNPRKLDNSLGMGIYAEDKIRLDFSNLFIDHSFEGGMLLLGPDTTSILNKISIANTSSQMKNGSLGFGLAIGLGSTAIANQISVHKAQGAGIQVLIHSHLEAENISVSDVRPSDDLLSSARGISLSGCGSSRLHSINLSCDDTDSSSLKIKNAYINDIQGIGLDADSYDATLNSDNLIIENIFSTQLSDLSGIGVHTPLSKRVQLSKILINNVSRIGIFDERKTPDSFSDINHLTVSHTGNSCSSEQANCIGHAVFIQTPADVNIHNFHLHDNSGVGLLLPESNQNISFSNFLMHHNNEDIVYIMNQSLQSIEPLSFFREL